MVVLFGDQGLIARSHYKQVLYQVRLDNSEITDDNLQLALHLRRLKNGKDQLELLAAEKLLISEDDVTIYRFLEEGSQ